MESYPISFDEFWRAYPRRVGKLAALRAYKKALKLAEPEVIIAGARRYAIARNGQEEQFTAHPSTWLNAGRWEDEYQQQNGFSQRGGIAGALARAREHEHELRTGATGGSGPDAARLLPDWRRQ